MEEVVEGTVVTWTFKLQLHGRRYMLDGGIWLKL